MKIIKRKNIINQFFCNHVYKEALRHTMFHNLEGKTIYLVCEKCGKIKKFKY